MSQQPESAAPFPPEQLAEIVRTAKALQAAQQPGGPALPRPVREFGDAMTPGVALALVGRLSTVEAANASLTRELEDAGTQHMVWQKKWAAESDKAQACQKQVAELKQELAEQRGAVASLLEGLAEGCEPTAAGLVKGAPDYWRGINSERAQTLRWAELMCEQLGIAWPIKPIPYKGDLPSEPAPAPPLEEAVPAAGWYPKQFYNSPEAYRASADEAIRKIKSGETQPREPENEPAAALPATGEGAEPARRQTVSNIMGPDGTPLVFTEGNHWNE